MNSAIQITELRKKYGGTTVLNDITLGVPEGSVFGFLGPNGAGKTTTLRILLGLANPTAGAAEILGKDVTATGAAVRQEIGFVPDVPGFYNWMTGKEFMQLSGRMFGMKGKELNHRVELLLELAGLTGVRQKVGAYSRGMKQRLGIAQGLINTPRLLLLDEPTSALDPIGRKEVLEMISQLRGKTTVFFSTHILADVERVCDRVAILDKGRVITQGPLAEIKSRYGGSNRYYVEVTERAEELYQSLVAAPWLEPNGLRPNGAGFTLSVIDEKSCQHQVPQTVASLGLGLRRFEQMETSLESVFVSLVEGEKA